ncbi:MAG: AlpA family phage regulatory protein [Proteobacteria bacterium]|nr:AlpA family phage regulatory protein [Pseudomonadota bacterium]
MRLPAVCDRTGKPKSTVYREIGEGLLPPAVRISERSSAWPDDEIDAVNRARLQGRTDSEIKALVFGLVSARPSSAARDAA